MGPMGLMGPNGGQWPVAGGRQKSWEEEEFDRLMASGMHPMQAAGMTGVVAGGRWPGARNSPLEAMALESQRSMYEQQHPGNPYQGPPSGGGVPMGAVLALAALLGAGPGMGQAGGQGPVAGGRMGARAQGGQSNGHSGRVPDPDIFSMGMETAGRGRGSGSVGRPATTGTGGGAGTGKALKTGGGGGRRADTSGKVLPLAAVPAITGAMTSGTTAASAAAGAAGGMSPLGAAGVMAGADLLGGMIGGGGGDEGVAKKQYQEGRRQSIFQSIQGLTNYFAGRNAEFRQSLGQY